MFLKRTVFILLLITSLLPILIESARTRESSRSTYGEPCNKTQRCKSQSWFTCDHDQGLCQCAKPDEMTFDSSKDKCVSLVGEACQFPFEDEGANQRVWLERSDCVPNAKCNESGICICPTGFYEDKQGSLCSTVKGHKDSCTSSIECNSDKTQLCINSTCRCDPETSIYNPTRFSDYTEYGTLNAPEGVCIGKVGSHCLNPGNYCVRNAFCDKYNRTCHCRNGYIETSEKLCGRGHSDDCTSNICSDRLRCIGKGSKDIQDSVTTTEIKCQCAHPKYQRYSSRTGSCRGLVGGPCDPLDPLGSGCINNASCIQREGIFQCECDSGFVDTKQGDCEIEFGHHCEYTFGNSNSAATLCDQRAHLVCRLGHCLCENELDVYSAGKRRCLTPVGLRCGGQEECVENSECLKIDTGSVWGRCSCSEGYIAALNHTCVAQPTQQPVTESTDAAVEMEITAKAVPCGCGHWMKFDDNDGAQSFSGSF